MINEVPHVFLLHLNQNEKGLLSNFQSTVSTEKSLTEKQKFLAEILPLFHQ